MNIRLLIVDPQNDFCIPDDGNGNQGALVVPGAKEDMVRVADMIGRIGDKLDDIHVTLDSHQQVGIERPAWWKSASDGSRPAPFTILGLSPDNRIVAVDMSSGTPVLTDQEFTTAKPSLYEPARQYLQALSDGGRYPHVVWPVHCVVGTWGWSIVPELSAALCEWEEKNFARVNYIVKGNNPMTEHFSGVKAEVPDPSDPSTQVNTGLIQTLEEADMIAITGEALSHCVISTVRDIADLFSDPQYVEKMILLTDSTSNVGGFEKQGEKGLKELQARGLKLSTSVDFLA